MDFNGKTAIVTGGTGALGSVIAEVLFDSGATIAIPYREAGSLQSIPLNLREAKRTFFGKANLNEEKDVRSFTEQVREHCGSIHILINAAGGYAGGKSIEEVPLDQWESMMSTNLRSAFLMCRSVLPFMKEQKFGRIVNIGAMAALTPAPRRGPYAISKRAVVTLTEVIAEEIKGTGITANAIAPSIIVTEANKKSMPNADTGKWVTPREIADLVLFLCSPEARSVSGNIIKIYGSV